MTENLNGPGRKFAFQFIYHFSMPEFSDQLQELMQSDSDLQDLIRGHLEATETELHPQSLEYSKSLISKCLSHHKEVVDTISQTSKNWKVERMNSVDLSVLKIGVTEILFLKDTPRKVVINEAINMAKEFGGKNSGPFVNGILDKVR